MFVKILPYYQLCAGCCMKFLRTVSCENDSHQEQNASDFSEHSNNNNHHPPLENGHSKNLVVNENDHVHSHSANGVTPTNYDRTRVKENAFERVIRQPPELIRICCWCFVRRRNESLSPSPDVSPRKGTTPLTHNEELTNVVLPLDGGTVYTPMKNFIGREANDGCHVVELESEEQYGEQPPPEEQLQDNLESPRSSSTGTDERLTNYCSTASTATELELVDGNEENNNNNNSSTSSRQQVGSNAQKLDLDQRPNLSPSKSYGNGGTNNNSYNSNGRFFGAETVETPHRSRYLGERDDGPAAAGGGINQESYIIHRDEQYDSENDEKSSNDSSSTRIISNSTFNFGSKGSDPYPPTPNVSHPPSILSSRPQSVTSHKSIGSGILKNDGRLSRTSNISYSNLSIKQSADNVSVKSSRSAKSRENTVWYERDGTPIRSEDVISSNQVNYESDYDEEVEEEIVQPQRSATPKRYPTPSPHPLQSSYSTEELSINSYQAEETVIAQPKSRVQSASLGNLQQLPDDEEEEPPQPAPAKKILKKPFLVRKSSKVAPVKEVVSGIKAKNKMNEVIFQKNLRKFDKPKDALSHCLGHLESPNWEQNISGLQFFVRLIRHHPEVIDSQIHLLSVALAKQVRNLRSQVARAACQASAEFFSTHRRCIEGEAEDIATHLLHRTADTNKFLRADATNALESMCENLSITKVIHIISTKGATHQNAVVRTTAAKLLDKIVHQIGAEKAFALPKESREKLVQTGGQLLLEGSLDTRNYTKSMFKQLSEHPSYNKVLLEVIPPRTYRNIEKSLNSIKQM